MLHLPSILLHLACMQQKKRRTKIETKTFDELKLNTIVNGSFGSCKISQHPLFQLLHSKKSRPSPSITTPHQPFITQKPRTCLINRLLAHPRNPSTPSHRSITQSSSRLTAPPPPTQELCGANQAERRLIGAETSRRWLCVCMYS